MAAPQYGCVVFVGKSGRTYAKDVYFSDAAAALVNWDSGAGAGATSETFWTAPEYLVMRDFSIHTGMTQTSARISRNGVPTGDTLRYAIHLDTLNNRPMLNIPFAPGDRISITQV
jgi:hypothetical protein